PDGTEVLLIDQDLVERAVHFDVLLIDFFGDVHDGTSDDLGLPFYDTFGAPDGVMEDFAGISMQGTWELLACGNALDISTLNHWSLLFLKSEPDVFVSKAVSNESVSVGELITYTLTVDNEAFADSSTISLTDQLPLTVDFEVGSLAVTPGAPAPTFNSGTISWQGVVSGTSTVVITYAVRANQGAVISNTVTITEANLFAPDTDSVTTFAFDTTAEETDTPGTAITDNSCATPQLFTVDIANHFFVTQVEVGLNMSHTHRGDLIVKLHSPAGTTIVLLPGNGFDGDDNYDVLLTDQSTNPVDDGDNDTVAIPVYDRQARSGDLLAGLRGEDSFGTWTLSVCDSAAAYTGTLHQWTLFLKGIDDAPTAVTPSIAAAGANFDLSWLHDSAENASYEVWRNTTPYFSPDSPGVDTIKLGEVVPAVPVGGLVTFEDTTAVAGTDYYYLIRATHTTDLVMDAVRDNGVFNFDITPGS
ncbi:MAG: proprotein convertase P-domain-containing protein, partial [Methylococcales bacterium]|nr:proprotein convertase P-domain-containing protein [Methylococcales bacterium]